MAERIVTTTVCDFCEQEEGPARLVKRHRNISLGHAKGNVDACDDCWEQIAGPLKRAMLLNRQSVS